MSPKRFLEDEADSRDIIEPPKKLQRRRVFDATPNTNVETKTPNAPFTLPRPPPLPLTRSQKKRLGLTNFGSPTGGHTAAGSGYGYDNRMPVDGYIDFLNPQQAAAENIRRQKGLAGGCVITPEQAGRRLSRFPRLHDIQGDYTHDARNPYQQNARRVLAHAVQRASASQSAMPLPGAQVAGMGLDLFVSPNMQINELTGDLMDGSGRLWLPQTRATDTAQQNSSSFVQSQQHNAGTDQADSFAAPHLDDIGVSASASRAYDTPTGVSMLLPPRGHPDDTDQVFKAPAMTDSRLEEENRGGLLQEGFGEAHLQQNGDNIENIFRSPSPQQDDGTLDGARWLLQGGVDEAQIEESQERDGAMPRFLSPQLEVETVTETPQADVEFDLHEFLTDEVLSYNYSAGDESIE